MNNNSLDFDWESTGLAHLVVVAWWFSVLELVVAKLDSDSALSRLGMNCVEVIPVGSNKFVLIEFREKMP